MKRLGFLTLAAALVVSLGFAQDGSSSDDMNMDFSSYDTNGDGLIDSEEFANASASSDMFARFDPADTGSLSTEQFQTGLFSVLDGDSNGSLSTQEFASAASSWGSSSTLTSTSLDVDGNSEISQQEFETFDTSDIYTRLDADASGDVSEEEFNQGIFSLADSNADTFVDESELTASSSLFGMRGVSMGGTPQGGTTDDSSTSTDDSSTGTDSTDTDSTGTDDSSTGTDDSTDTDDSSSDDSDDSSEGDSSN
mgnify:CR=1 FL=1